MLKKYTTLQLLIVSLLSALFVLYPDITWLPYEFQDLLKAEWFEHISFFILRYAFFAGLVFILLRINIQKLSNPSFKKRVFYSLALAIACYAVYGGFSYLLFTHVRHYGSLVLFQCLVVSLLSSLIGYIVELYTEQRKKEQQIEELTVKSLQSRYDALTNQINPHFFFNSLNGLTSLIRKKDDERTLNYVNKLSDVFRYILQSDQKGMVSLTEELAFVEAFRYMMEVRFANKLKFRLAIDQNAANYSLPVLSILPLLDNIVVHNTIDSDHIMNVDIYIEGNLLVIANPIYPKLIAPVTNGTGLSNLEGRFHLLLNQALHTENDGKTFKVYLPLK